MTQPPVLQSAVVLIAANQHESAGPRSYPPARREI